jgi:hypothetical protein
VDGQYIITLMDHWKYDSSSYPNKSSHCFIVEIIHLKLMIVYLKSWSMTIDDDLADLDTVPELLAKIFIPAKGSSKNPFRDPVKTSPSKDPNPSDSSSFQQLIPQSFPSFIPPNFGYYPFISHDQYPQLPPVLSSSPLQ